MVFQMGFRFRRLQIATLSMDVRQSRDGMYVAIGLYSVGYLEIVRSYLCNGCSTGLCRRDFEVRSF